MSTSRSEDFLLFSGGQDHNNMTIITCRSNLEYLCTARLILADGTFYVSPKYFYQMYTLHVHINGRYFPLVFAMLERKTEATYVQFLQKIIEQCASMGLLFQPEQVIVDFDTATQIAFQSIFQAVSILCCRFHMGQAIYRKILQLGLSNDYKNKDRANGKWLKLFFGLPFLDPSEVGDCFAEDIMCDAPSLAPYEAFADYMLNTYITDHSLFPPIKWAALPQERNPRTNNAAESFHAHLKKYFSTPHQLYLSGNITRKNYVARLSYKFLPVS